MANILAARYPTFQKAMRIINTISNGNPAIVTTTFAHQYQDGLIVRFRIPPQFGMQEINNKTGVVTVIDAISFYVDIDTSLMSPFAYASAFPFNRQYPQVVPVGEVNRLLNQATANVLPYRGI